MDKDERELAFQYSWNWFKYHAQQRYSAFNYFLLVIGALSWAYVQNPITPNNDMRLIKTAIGILGFIISLAFLFIERRNNELVNDGRAGLDKLEDEKKGLSPFIEYHIRRIDKDNRKGKLLLHCFWFRFVIISALVAAWASILYPQGCDVKCITISSVIVFILGVIAAYMNERIYELK